MHDVPQKSAHPNRHAQIKIDSSDCLEFMVIQNIGLHMINYAIRVWIILISKGIILNWGTICIVKIEVL